MESENKRHIVLIALVGAVALIARFVGTMGELWLDEVWALTAARSLKSPFALYSNVALDGHQSLYTLLMYWGASFDAPFIQRLPALLASLLSLPVFLSFTKETNFSARIVALLFFSLSYPVVLYSTEARGYSLMLFFGLLSMQAVFLFRTKFSWGSVCLFWSTTIIAFLSNYTFLQIYLAEFLWSAYYFRRNLKKLILMHIVPALFLGGFYCVVLQALPKGSGPLAFTVDSIINIVSVGFNGPVMSAANMQSGIVAFSIAVFVLVCCAFELWFMAKARNERVLFYFCGLFVAPLIIFCVANPRIVLERYFLMQILLCHLLCASFLSRLWVRTVLGKVLAMLCVIAFTAGGINHLTCHYFHGRGTTEEALRYIASHSPPAGVINISSDQHFRTVIMIDRYSLLNSSRFKYQREPEQATWYLTQTQDSYAIPDEQKIIGDHSFRFMQSFDFTAFSGWRWDVYQRHND